MKYGFIKTAVTAPEIRVADCQFNAEKIIDAMNRALERNVQLLVLPELCITGSTCGDLFLQSTLLRGATAALRQIVTASRGNDMLVVVGLPLRKNGRLYDCAAVLQNGKLLGVIPKNNTAKWNNVFSPAPEQNLTIPIENSDYPFGPKLLFRCRNMDDLCLAAEVGSDLLNPTPSSRRHASAGATIIANCSASGHITGIADFRRNVITVHSANCLCAYACADAGYGESTTDLVFAGHGVIAESGHVIAEAVPFSGDMAISEVDVNRLAYERRRTNSFLPENFPDYATIYFDMFPRVVPLTRKVYQLPFVPLKEARYNEILNIQGYALKKRLEHTKAKAIVIGVSGGLDSCLALIASLHALRLMNRPATDLIAVSMPCFGTSSRTKGNAEKLCALLGVSFREIDISDSVRRHFVDIGQDESAQDVAFENAQARERTQVIMDIANQVGGFVVGTGDLSELALGFATYNGDHMSMYGINSGIPKTLVRKLVAFIAGQCDNPELSNVLLDIVATPVSPELLPPNNSEISQVTEDIVGPYELHDFFLYYIVRWGFSPAKVLHIAAHAFSGTYEPAFVLSWLKVFYKRFFAQQFKRSCLPDGPQIGSVTLSPRGGWHMPSDACVTLWLNELETL